MMRVFKLLIITTILLITSCNQMQMARDYGYIYLRWELDDYFDLNKKQYDFVKKEYFKLVEQAETTILPLLLIELDEIKGLVKNDKLKPEHISIYRERIYRLYRLCVMLVMDTSLDFLMTLDKSQIDHFVEEIAEQVEERQELVNKPEKERQDHQIKRIISNYERWFEDLADNQEKAISQFVEKHPFDYKLHLEHRKKMTDAFVKILRQGKRDALKTYLTDVFLYPEKVRDPAYHTYITEIRKLTKRLIWDVYALASQEQKEFFMERIDGFRELRAK